MGYPTFSSQAYLDTSYFVNLLSYPRNPKDKRFLACKHLYDHCQKNDIRLVASFLTIQETIHVLLFKRWLLRAARDKKLGLADFRRKHRKEFEQLYKKHAGIPKLILQSARGLGIELCLPQYTNPQLNMSRRLTSYSAALLGKYVSLDSCDSYHIAIARLLGVDLVFACDKAFSDVSEIKTYNPCL